VLFVPSRPPPKLPPFPSSVTRHRPSAFPLKRFRPHFKPVAQPRHSRPPSCFVLRAFEFVLFCLVSGRPPLRGFWDFFPFTALSLCPASIVPILASSVFFRVLRMTVCPLLSSATRLAVYVDQSLPSPARIPPRRTFPAAAFRLRFPGKWGSVPSLPSPSGCMSSRWVSAMTPIDDEPPSRARGLCLQGRFCIHMFGI